MEIQNLKLAMCFQIIKTYKYNGQISLDKNKLNQKSIICRIQYFEADFLLKVSLKILNSGIIMKTFTHVYDKMHSVLTVSCSFNNLL